MVSDHGHCGCAKQVRIQTQHASFLSAAVSPLRHMAIMVDYDSLRHVSIYVAVTQTLR